jgi:hypothetical protein
MLMVMQPVHLLNRPLSDILILDSDRSIKAAYVRLPTHVQNVTEYRGAANHIYIITRNVYMYRTLLITETKL